MLDGAQPLLQRQAFDLILTEVWFDAPYVDAPHFCEIRRNAAEPLLPSWYGLYYGPHQYGNHPVFTADAI